ncbi:MAG TPA: tetratricopeptide repeat protein [Thermoanaerobaculia bacterium]|nr:tetratricopeptide repeat protein [Thermoanaerobaculia bacterium]
MDGARAQGWWAVVPVLVFSSVAAAQVPSEILHRAQQLAWKKEFAGAERLYREALGQTPRSRDAKFGLAQVILWQGRYREARRLFEELLQRNANDVAAAEGAASAVYWQGDFRTAEREFTAITVKHPDRKYARQALAEIRSASRGDIRMLFDGVHDDQPYRAARISTTVSSFTDPLTRWDISGGAYRMNNPDRNLARTEPFVTLTNEVVLPWQKLTITSTGGVLRFPDGATRPIGGLSVAHRLTSDTSITAAVDHRELLTNASSIVTHPNATRFALAWTRYAAKSWLAGVEVAHQSYYDHNDGHYAQGYALWPIVKRDQTTLWIGASAAARDTRETRFGLDAISSSRTPAGDFAYSYRGSYRAYWTPRDLREVRAILSIARMIGANAELKAQAEQGVARDEARGFGPARGSAALPPHIFDFEFHRVFHPYRLSVAFSSPISAGFRLECGVERALTSFYAANAFRASLVRHR